MTLNQDDVEELSDLVGGIYDAAIDAAQWPGALGTIMAYVGGKSAALFYRDVVKRQGEVYYDINVEPEFRASYFEKYIKLDPTLIGYNLAPLCEPISTIDVMPYDEFTQSRFYKEWAVPQGLVDTVGAVLDRTATSAAIIGIMRTQMADEQAMRKMRLVSPHARRAVLIGTLLDWHIAKSEGLADSLDGVHAGFFLIDAQARVLHTNVSGAVMLEKGKLFQMNAGHLAVHDPQCAGRIMAALSGADTAEAISMIATDGSRHVAHVLLLTKLGQRLKTPGNAAAAIFVTATATEAPIFPNIIASAYGLTPSEVRTLLAIVEIGNVSKAADALGIAKTTAKFHLSNVFAKTGTSRQAELLKLVAAYTSPLL